MSLLLLWPVLVYNNAAAGADIKEMSKLTFAEAYGQDKFNEWARLGKIRKPVRNGRFILLIVHCVLLQLNGAGRFLFCVTTYDVFCA